VTSENTLVTELETFAAHRDELVAAGEGKYALVHGQEVVGVYDTEGDAIRQGYTQFGNVPFLVKHVVQVEVPERFVSNLLAI
jgi:hypothetical protein